MARPVPAPLEEITILSGLPRVTVAAPAGDIVVGRAEDAEFVLDHPSVEPYHCRLKLAGGGRRVEPLVPHSRTFLDGRPVEAEVGLKPGQILTLGEVSLTAGRGPAAELSILSEGHLLREIPMQEGTRRLGRSPECEILLPDESVAPFHALLEGDDQRGFTISRAGGPGRIRANGLLVETHRLIYGDEITLGAYRLTFTGRALRLPAGDRPPAITVHEACVERDGRDLVHQVSLEVKPGEFVGLIGPTGAGKSTLLRVMTGLLRPDHGSVTMGGRDLYASLAALRPRLGWVPQGEIVHRELTVRQALTFTARLRLPRELSRAEIGRSVAHAAETLGLSGVLDSRIRDLSGGEARKTSVAAEMVSRPRALLLDEPTSGLDPGAEGKLMAHFRRLADEGCSVLCSTHVMKHVFLFDRTVILSGGRKVFDGTPAEARKFFGTSDAEGIFDRLERHDLPEWESSAPPPAPDTAQTARPPVLRPGQWRVLLARQAAILFSDWRTPLILLGQPILIGLLLAWTARGTADDSALRLFFIGISCLWFGCGNGAPEIVGETEIYLRERMAGLGRFSYAAAKWLFGGALTLLQTLVLFGLVKGLGAGFGGAPVWQLGGLAVMSFLAAAIGLALSAASRTPMQAVLLVPVFLIPQILFSGFAIPASSMPPEVRRLAALMPAFQLQHVLDVSLIWQRTVDASLIETHLQAFRNVNLSVPLRLGDTLTSPEPARTAAATACAWLGLSGIILLAALAGKERA